MALRAGCRRRRRPSARPWTRSRRRLGPISILVNNAGVGGEGLALDLSIEDWDRTFDVNVRGVFFAARRPRRG